MIHALVVAEKNIRNVVCNTSLTPAIRGQIKTHKHWQALEHWGQEHWGQVPNCEYERVFYIAFAIRDPVNRHYEFFGKAVLNILMQKLQ